MKSTSKSANPRLLSVSFGSSRRRRSGAGGKEVTATDVDSVLVKVGRGRAVLALIQINDYQHAEPHGHYAARRGRCSEAKIHGDVDLVWRADLPPAQLCSPEEFACRDAVIIRSA